MATLPMTAPEMMAEARQQTRISIVDEKIIVALEKLVDSFNRDGQPHDEGAEMLHPAMKGEDAEEAHEKGADDIDRQHP